MQINDSGSYPHSSASLEQRAGSRDSPAEATTIRPANFPPASSPISSTADARRMARKGKPSLPASSSPESQSSRPGSLNG
jgi:hypothetical protein